MDMGNLFKKLYKILTFVPPPNSDDPITILETIVLYSPVMQLLKANMVEYLGVSSYIVYNEVCKDFRVNGHGIWEVIV